MSPTFPLTGPAAAVDVTALAAREATGPAGADLERGDLTELPYD
jgi:hypothetical protein